MHGLLASYGDKAHIGQLYGTAVVVDSVARMVGAQTYSHLVSWAWTELWSLGIWRGGLPFILVSVCVFLLSWQRHELTSTDPQCPNDICCVLAPNAGMNITRRCPANQSASSHSCSGLAPYTCTQQKEGNCLESASPALSFGTETPATRLLWALG